MTALVQLPKDKRPDVPYKKCMRGVDLPAWFIDEIQGIDQHIYPVWHEHRLLWEATIMNRDYGDADDPRHVINYDYGHLNFGFVFTNGKGEPSKQHRWHLWRLNKDHGWAHIYELAATHPEYLKTVLHKLWFQGYIIDNYGWQTFMKIHREKEEDLRDEEKKVQQEWYEACQQENAWLTRAAMDNFHRGKTKPTSPQKETISSYSGQGKRSRLSRDLQDEDVLIIPGR
jgi:hypothetical protein